MKKNGSASIVLIFAVLCLTIFSVISLVTALNEETLIKNEVALVTAYYEADSLAEKIFSEIFFSEEIPSEIFGIEIFSYIEWDTFREIVSFMCPISETKGLYVMASLDFDAYEILTWRMQNLADWQPNEELNVWQGDFDENFMSGW
jgi:hypothetical protein